MARTLTPIAAVIDLDPDTYELRTGSPYPTVSPSGSLVCTLGSDAVPNTISVQLNADGTPVDDDTFDVSTNGPRVIDLPVIAGTGIRAWYGIEVFPYVQPADTALLFRVHDGTDDLWWDGAAWSVASTISHWNTVDELLAAFASLGAGVRSMTLRVWLQVDAGAEASPELHSIAVLYGVRDRGDEDDALLRSLSLALRDGIRVTGELRWTTDGSSSYTLTVTGSGAVPPIERPYDLTGVRAVYDLTADPDEESALAGSWSPGTLDALGRAYTGTWTPSVAPVSGSLILMEFEFRPQVVVFLEEGALDLEKLPQIRLTPTGSTRRFSGGSTLLRRLDLDPPVGLELAHAEVVDDEITISAIARSRSDARRTGDALRKWISGGRRIVSPESGRVVSVVEVAPMRSVSGPVPEVRGEWRIAYEVATASAVEAVHLVRDGGVAITTSATGG